MAKFSCIGFAIGKFASGDLLTEVPNLLIGAGKKERAPRKPVLKRPAACSPAGSRIGLEYYKRDNSFGVRERDGMKRSLLKVRCSTMTREELQIIADEARRRLAQGDDIAEVKQTKYKRNQKQALIENQKSSSSLKSQNKL